MRSTIWSTGQISRGVKTYAELYGLWHSTFGRPFPPFHVNYGILKLRWYFSKSLAEGETVSVCKACRFGAMDTDDDSHPSPLKVVLSSEQDFELLLSRRKKLASFAPNIFFTEIIPYQSA